MTETNVKWAPLQIVLLLVATGCAMVHGPDTAGPPPDRQRPSAVPTGTASAEPIVTTLDNGMTVALIENHQSPVVALRVYVRTGGMTEGKYLGAGISHFLEHLVAGGTTSCHTEAESQATLDSIGAQANAYTTQDHTCYYLSTASRFFDEGLALLSDWIMNASITTEEFDREFEVIQREMESRWSDPNIVLRQLMSQTMFKVHPVRNTVIGYREAFRKLTREDVWAYYRSTYLPDNAVFVAAGDFDCGEALDKVRAAFAGFERRPSAPAVLPTEPPQLARREASEEMPASQAYLMMGFRTIPLSHPDLYALDLISFILSNGESSRLVRKLREERRLVSTVSSWSHTPGYDAGEFVVRATLDPNKLDDAKPAILQELFRFREELVSQDELSKAKRQKISEHVFGLQTAEALAANLASDILSAHDPNFSRAYVERIQQPDAEDLRIVAQKYFREENLCIAVVSPPAAAAVAPASVPTSQAKQDEVLKNTLGNGLRLLVKRNAAQPIVAVRAFFIGGVRAEPDGLSGLSGFTARMLPRGTALRSAEEIARAFDEMGGSLGASSGNNTLYVSVACLAEDFARALEILADVARNPAFDRDEMERLRPLLIAASARQRDDWRGQLSEYFRKEFFKSHPYRNSSLGEIEGLRAIQSKDLIQFHHDYCVPNNLVLAVFGDVDPEEVMRLVDRHFGDWPASAAFQAPAPAPEPPLASDRNVEAQSKHPLAGVFVGFPGLRLQDVNDRYAMDVLDALTSGIHLPRGWLHESLRGKGLVYEVHAYSFPGLEPGYFGVYAGCEPARAEEVKEIILRQMQRAVREKTSEDELEAARRICVSADVLEHQTNAQQATEAALNELYGMGYDFGDKYAAGVLSVTAQDVQRVADKYLTHHLCVVMRPEAPGQTTSSNEKQP